jgi:hypothetical protein
MPNPSLCSSPHIGAQRRKTKRGREHAVAFFIHIHSNSKYHQTECRQQCCNTTADFVTAASQNDICVTKLPCPTMIVFYGCSMIKDEIKNNLIIFVFYDGNDLALFCDAAIAKPTVMKQLRFNNYIP